MKMAVNIQSWEYDKVFDCDSFKVRDVAKNFINRVIINYRQVAG